MSETTEPFASASSSRSVIESTRTSFENRDANFSSFFKPSQGNPHLQRDTIQQTSFENCSGESVPYSLKSVDRQFLSASNQIRSVQHYSQNSKDILFYQRQQTSQENEFPVSIVAQCYDEPRKKQSGVDQSIYQLRDPRKSQQQTNSHVSEFDYKGGIAIKGTQAVTQSPKGTPEVSIESPSKKIRLTMLKDKMPRSRVLETQPSSKIDFDVFF
jgi:hypothetical protein